MRRDRPGAALDFTTRGVGEEGAVFKPIARGVGEKKRVLREK